MKLSEVILTERISLRFAQSCASKIEQNIKPLPLPVENKVSTRHPRINVLGPMLTIPFKSYTAVYILASLMGQFSFNKLVLQKKIRESAWWE